MIIIDNCDKNDCLRPRYCNKRSSHPNIDPGRTITASGNARRTAVSPSPYRYITIQIMTGRVKYFGLEKLRLRLWISVNRRDMNQSIDRILSANFSYGSSGLNVRITKWKVSTKRLLLIHRINNTILIRTLSHNLDRLNCTQHLNAWHNRPGIGDHGYQSAIWTDRCFGRHYEQTSGNIPKEQSGLNLP
jgi:hypothetical protein